MFYLKLYGLIVLIIFSFINVLLPFAIFEEFEDKSSIMQIAFLIGFIVWISAGLFLFFWSLHQILVVLGWV